ncbi:hypothetical protein [Palaeococcus ferrophilus]|uniref:hypothetical protein n=1 Tax=Palaeococcus ferrophilus TaxID=83868 RepID=UPI0012F72CC0|nr:hypothetical protein [Palaeococcus ferrophilus]
MIEEERMGEIIESALKDRKVVEALIELLDDNVMGIRGDALLLLSEVISRDSKTLRGKVDSSFVSKLFALVSSKNPYVRENAMVFLKALLESGMSVPKEAVLRGAVELVESGDKNQKAFGLIMLKAVNGREAIESVRPLIEVQDKVILPFEGYKWVPLGEIARDVMNSLGGE